MRYNKFKAFTLAEVMILLLTLSILLAAFAPVFTRRFQNVATDDVWTYVTADDNYNAYFDVPNKIYINSAFIGLNPTSADDVLTLTKDRLGGKVVYSKLIVAASKKLGLSGVPQNQMQFRYGDSAQGNLVGTLFAGGGNMLVGGPYSNIKTDASSNTSFGTETLKDLTTGKWNTAVGSYSLKSTTTGEYNTAIGYSAGENIVSGKMNTVIGSEAGKDMGSSSEMNTVVGYNAGYSVLGDYNTAVGFRALEGEAGHGNTAVGSYALNSATGNYNTAVGSNALSLMTKGNYNTAIGANSCLFIGRDSSEYSKITCIGSNSAQSAGAKLPTGTGENYNVPDRVFIGTYPVGSSSITSNSSSKPFAVLEVHNSVKAPNSDMIPVPNGEESVIINGNLIVRGQSYFEVPIFRAIQAQKYSDYTHNNIHNPKNAPKGLVLFKLFKQYNSNFYIFGAYDGADRSGGSYGGCRGCKSHAFGDIRSNCICTAVGPGYGGNTNYDASASVRYSSTSYDWFSKTNHANSTTQCNDGASTYKDQSTCNSVTLSHNPDGQGDSDNAYYYGTKETDKPLAHLGDGNSSIGYSCCPNLTGRAETTSSCVSDIRLKNVGDKFTAGLDEIKKLKVYNFTFKNDENKIPQVGVIAQELKVVFPQAVSKNSDGYYTIRWDEMLYAAINAVKTLNSKINALADKIATDKERIATLKRDNAQMYAQLDNLAKELETLEAKKK